MLLTAFALYLTISIVGTQTIYGVQGRYFLQLLVLVLFATRGLLNFGTVRWICDRHRSQPASDNALRHRLVL